MALSKKEKLLQAAQKNIQKGQWLKAAKDVQKVLELDPKDVRSRQRLAELLNRAGLMTESLEAYESVAKYYADNGFYLKAIAVYKQMQKINPSQEKIYRRLALLNEKQGLVGNALGEYRGLAELYEKSGNVAELNETLEKMKELDPENSGLRLRICQSYLKNAISDKAHMAVRDTLVLLEKTREPASTGKLKDLIQSYLSDDIGLKLDIGRVLLLCKQPEETVELLAGETSQHPEQRAILPILAQAYRQMGDFTSERQVYELLLADEPDNIASQEAFVRACLDCGDDQEALDRLECWKETFLCTDRISVLKEFYEQLQIMRGDDEQVRQTLHQIYENTGEGSKLFDLLSENNQKGSQAKVASTGDPDTSGEWFGSDLLEAEEDGFFQTEDPQPVATALDSQNSESSSIDNGFSLQQEAQSFAGADEETFESLLPEDDGIDGDAVPDQILPAHDDDEIIELEFELELDEFEEESMLEDISPTALIEETGISDETADLQAGIGFDAPDSACDSDGGSADVPVENSADMTSFDAESPLSQPQDFSNETSVMDDGLADLQRELGEVFDMDSFDLEDDDEPDLTSELEEAEFYLQQNFIEEARKKCQSLLERAPHCKEACEMLQQAEARLAQDNAASTASSEAEVTMIAADTTEKAVDSREQSRLEGNISAFKKGIEDAVAQDDCETHYDLGIAYREMGLLEEAIEEFTKAMGHPSRYTDALTLIGTCLVSKEDFEQAAELFRQGLLQDNLPEGDRLNLYFELGQLYVAWNRPLEALDSFQQVADTDISYRDVGDHIRKLRDKLGLDDGGDIGGPAGGPGSNRVSYL
jgi:tetratricopeptide (TPR) repeat protein